MKERVIQHLKLAQILAAKYFNVPGATREEVLSEAHTALVKASMAYKEDKGPFAPFAGTVIRNALNSMYKKQLRQVQMIGKSLDETICGSTQFGTLIGNLGQNIQDSKVNVLREIKKREKAEKLYSAIKTLNEKERFVIVRASRGMTLEEISKEMLISKQAIHKILKFSYKKIRLYLKDEINCK